jgi:hypothetical protein
LNIVPEYGAGEFTQAAGWNNDVDCIVSEIIRSPEIESFFCPSAD